MIQEMKELWQKLDRPILVNQRELVLGISACALAGMLAGILLSPKKAITIGSNNGSNNHGSSAGTVNPLDSQDGEDEREA